MPQKKNPDAAELLRAKAPRVVGHLVTLHGVLHGLPLTYNKDLQEDKEPLFDAIDTVELCLRVAPAMLAGLEFDRERMAAASADEMLAATDVADLLVRRGVPFREARDRGRRGARRGGRRQDAVRAHPGRAARAGARAGGRRSPRVLSDGAWLESKVSRGGHLAAARARPAGPGPPRARRSRG